MPDTPRRPVSRTRRPTEKAQPSSPPSRVGKPGALGVGGGLGESGERLQKVLAARGIASRRAAEEIIKAGRVKVNGKVVREMGVKVNPERDNILVDNKQLARPRMRYVILHKPSGYITTTSDERGRWTVMDLVDFEERVLPVGRLDRDTEGLLLMTNDGEVAHRVMHPRYGIQKEYHALVSPLPNREAMQALGAGMELRDEEGQIERTAPAKVNLLPFKHGEQWLRIVISEGRKRQVRRMLEAVGCEVHRLVRVRLGPLVLTGVPKGAWRELTPGERRELFVALKLNDVEMPTEERA
ncbi:MAG: rRNA pseudouridine synthase [Chloroflexota bacterium]|nr:rRNA pseudouridine synthase [Chloroflexota bacterium]